MTLLEQCVEAVRAALQTKYHSIRYGSDEATEWYELEPADIERIGRALAAAIDAAQRGNFQGLMDFLDDKDERVDGDVEALRAFTAAAKEQG